jgi:nitrite reductase/ring-hydroxylating ferredoxin subunit
MGVKSRLAAVESVPENGSLLFTVREDDGRKEEVVLVRGDDCIEAWKNFCQHEPDQRLDRGFGAAVRDGEILCPKHGSPFDACTGRCDSGKAAGTTLAAVDVAVEGGAVYLVDDDCRYLHDGGIDDGDDAPGSTSHLTF